MLERADVDVIDICTPPGTHAEIAIAAARAGKSVICEKPLATNYHDAAAARDAVLGRACITQLALTIGGSRLSR